MAELVRELHAISIFDILSDEEKDQLWAKSETVKFRLGQVICAAGSPGDGFYIISEGRARVIGKSADNQELNLGVLSQGDHFGEEILLGINHYEFTIRAASNLTALKLSWTDFEELFRNHPELDKYFKDYLSNRGMQAFLKKSTVLSPMNADELRAFLSKFRIESYAPNQDIVQEGDKGDSFFIIRSGHVEVFKKSAGAKAVSQLSEGDFFGELALLTGYPYVATVRAQEETTVFRLDKKDFDELIIIYPKIKDAILVVSAGYSDNVSPLGRDDETHWSAALDEPASEEHWETLNEVEEAGFFKRRRPWRLPVILQQSITDCGAASLAMVSRYYGINISINRLRDMANVSTDGASLYSLAEAAEALGFATKGLGTSIEDLATQPLPAIAHWQGNHFIVVYRVTRDKITVADPGIGLVDYSPQEFNEGWTGNLLTLRPTVKLQQVEESKTTLGRFIPYLKPYRGILAEVFLASLVIQMFGLATPLFTQAIIDRVLVFKSVDVLNMLLIGMLIVTFFSLITNAIRQYLIANTARSMDISMVLDFYRHVLDLPLKFFTQRRVGDIISRVNENQKIREMLTTTSLSAVLDGMTLVVYLALMFVYSVKLAALATVFIPFFALTVLVFTPVMKQNSRQAFQAEVEVQSHTVEAISAMSTVKALSVEKIVRWRLEDKLKNATKLQVNASMISLGANSVASLLQSLSSVLVLWLGARLVIGGDMTPGQLMAFSVLLGSVLGPVLRVVGLWDQFQEVRIAMERLNDVFDAEVEEPNPENTVRLPRLQGSIKFDKVTFRYDKEGKNIIQNVNLEVFPGQTIALVGRSGCGKTTLINLLMRLYQPNSGKILIDGYDLRQVSVSSLRRQMGVVPQDSVLFNGTIRENIAYHQPDARFEQIVSAAMLAGAHDFVSELPLGYETVIGERGMSISGGQRQRIAIARALLGNPQVLILDEATSSLDTESERVIQNNLENILKDRTTFIIAHRLSTVRKADLIVVLDQGVIVEQGTHDQLIAAHGLYYYLNNQQLNQ
ncbi:MAG: peptidase domain-containing ABC transporter [Acidobacteriota bacterium]